MDKREKWLLGIFLVTISLAFDIMIAVTINKHYEKTSSTYRTALKTTNRDKFNYIVDSHQGNVITHTKLKADKPVKFPEMKRGTGGLAVKRTLQQYTEHSETTTDSKGHTTTTYYWTWDDVDTDSRYAKNVHMFGRQYKLSIFDVNGYFDSIAAKKITDGDNGLTGAYHYLDSYNRYEYEIIPTTIAGTFIANTSSGTLKPLKDNSKINLSQESYKGYLKDGQSAHPLAAVCIVVVLMLCEGVMIGFALKDDDPYQWGGWR
ncbi:MAG: hypothetical protein ACLRX6_03320 [Limosilactobacillus pontis]|uniref:hypothetical protein n=1 Tax=Limosilactobacillus pontis TaxID=35787 RepID=UPI0039A1D4C3